MKILGIETSCDETAAAVIDERAGVLSNVISSQEVHLKFGGVVPELASRAHLRKIIPIVNLALAKAGVGFADLQGFAVTHGPGLVGALLVGLNYVKGLSLAFRKPFVGINHIEGHIYSVFLDRPELQPPFVCLVVSGGHTQIMLVISHLQYKVLGKTRDDAVGEAFDKVAKLLDLPYPGGPEIDRLARQGNPDFVNFPRALFRETTFDFSYSGLKTAVLSYLKGLSLEVREKQLPDICAAFQLAAVEVLVEKTIRAARTYQIPRIAIAGGVASNSLLRSLMLKMAAEFHLKFFCPPRKYCTDNAAMIARAGLERMKRGLISSLELNAFPSLPLEEEGQVE